MRNTCTSKIKAGRWRKEMRVEVSPENWVKHEQKEEMHTWWG